MVLFLNVKDKHKLRKTTIFNSYEFEINLQSDTQKM